MSVHREGTRAVFTCSDGVGAALMSRDGFWDCIPLQGLCMFMGVV